MDAIIPYFKGNDCVFIVSPFFFLRYFSEIQMCVCDFKILNYGN